MTSSGYGEKCFKVTTRDLLGVFDLSRYGPCGKSVCVFHEGEWITPTEFRAKAVGCATDSFKWKRLLKLPDNKCISVGKHLAQLKVNNCVHQCQCINCKRALLYRNGKRKTKSSKPNESLNSLLQKSNAKKRETDADSGISNVSSTHPVFDSSFDVVSATGLIQPSGEGKRTEYTLMVREAIANVSSGTAPGCNRMSILLFILNKYQPSDSIVVVNEKVKTTLRLLLKLGVVGKAGVNDDDSDLEDVCEEPLSHSTAEAKQVTVTDEFEPVKFKAKKFYSKSKEMSKVTKRVKDAKSLDKSNSLGKKQTAAPAKENRGRSQGNVEFRKPRTTTTTATK